MFGIVNSIGKFTLINYKPMKTKKTFKNTFSIVLLTLFISSFSISYAQNHSSGFLANAGQMKDTNDSVRTDLLYSASAAGAKIFIRQQGISFCWYQAAADSSKKDSSYRMDVDFLNPSNSLLISASQPQNTYSNYFIGSISAANVLEYNKITFSNLWNHIDLELTLDSNGFNYKYILNNGANPSDIKLSFNGGKNYNSGSKSLIIAAGFGATIQFNNFSIKALSPSKTTQPTISSNLNSSKVNSLTVNNYNANNSYEISQTVLRGPCTPGPGCNPVNAAIGYYNKWSTFYGGKLDDEVIDTYVDAQNNIYVLGNTVSVDFPETPNAAQDGRKLNQEIFVAKFAENRSRVFSTYFGGDGNDYASSIAVNSLGSIYFCGYTNSINYRVLATGNQYTSFKVGAPTGMDGVITQLNSNGSSVLWSTYLGTSSQLFCKGLAIGSDNQVYVIGYMESSSTSLPTVPLTNAYNQPLSNTNQNVPNSFIARFSSSNQLNWCTYFGGVSSTFLTSCDVDGSNNLLIAGRTFNSGTFANGFTNNGNLPIWNQQGGYLQNNGGNSDLYMARFSPQGIINWATFYGGTAADGPGFNDINIISADQSSSIYITSTTSSLNLPLANFSNSQTVFGGGFSDAFLLRLDYEGTIKFATYIGGSGNESGLSVDAHDETGNFIASGSTTSSNFPTFPQGTTYFDGTLGGTNDGFYQMHGLNNVKIVSTYLGGSLDDESRSINFNRSGNIEFVVGGATKSSNFPYKDIPGVIDYTDTVYNGANDGYIMNLQYCLGACRVAIQAENENSSFQLFPNPTNGFFTVKSNEKEPIEKVFIINSIGQIILTTELENKASVFDFDISDLSKGMYFIQLKTATESKIQKLIVQ